MPERTKLLEQVEAWECDHPIQAYRRNRDLRRRVAAIDSKSVPAHPGTPITDVEAVQTIFSKLGFKKRNTVGGFEDKTDFSRRLRRYISKSTAVTAEQKAAVQTISCEVGMHHDVERLTFMGSFMLFVQLQHDTRELGPLPWGFSQLRQNWGPGGEVSAQTAKLAHRARLMAGILGDFACNHRRTLTQAHELDPNVNGNVYMKNMVVLAGKGFAYKLYDDARQEFNYLAAESYEESKPIVPQNILLVSIDKVT